MTPANSETNFAKSSEQAQADLATALVSIYPQLRRIARGMLSRERSSHTLQPTALANEVVARLLKREFAGEDRRSIVNAGIREMQTILIDSGRRLSCRRANSSVVLNDGRTAVGLEDVVHLQVCLEKLGKVDPRAREVVELRFFLGLTIPEVAEHLEVSTRTINEDWEFARCWLAKSWMEA